MANNTQLASDNFASGSLAAGWSAVFGYSTGSVVSVPPNVVQCAALNTHYGQIWTGLTWPNDHISEVTVNALTAEANTFINILVRYQTGANQGYAASITNNVYTIYRDSTPLATGSITVAAGDILALCASGSIISFYQNYKRIAYINDTTYTSGSPGFLQYTATNVTHSRVASWRGYSCVQQDGIWQKQGITIPGIASSYTSSGIGPVDNSKIFFGPSVLGSGNVYYTWFSDGPQSIGAAIWYAESPDGKNWTRSNSAILTGYLTPTVIQNGPTYYMYCQPGASAGTGDFACYTSTDRQTWSQQSTTIIGLGTGGAWDSAFLWSFNPVAIINGTWYALYSAGSDTTGYQFSTGLATSSDGLTWTKYAGNPVTAGYVGQAIVNVQGTWYAWFALSQPGQGGTYPNEDPAEAIRKQSVDLITWTNPTHSVHHSQLFEGVNSPNGQCYFNSIIDIGGKAYAYTTSTNADNTTPQLFQIGLVIGPSTIENIVGGNEDGIQLVASDNFSYGAGPLSANWTQTGATNLKVVSGPYVEPTATGLGGSALYTGASFGQNQYSEITIHSLSGTLSASQLYAYVLGNTSGATNYLGTVYSPTGTSDTAARIYKTVSGVSTQIGPTATCEPQAGDVWRLSVFFQNGIPILSLFQNGFLILQVADVSGSPITSGLPGMGAYSSLAIADAQIASWAGGNANVIPNYPTAYNSFLGESAVEAIELEAYSWGEFHVAPRWKK